VQVGLHNPRVLALEQNQRRTEADGLEDLRRNLVHANLAVMLDQHGFPDLSKRHRRIPSLETVNLCTERAVKIEHVRTAFRTQGCPGRTKKPVPVVAVDARLGLARDVDRQPDRIRETLDLSTDQILLVTQLTINLRQLAAAISDRCAPSGERSYELLNAPRFGNIAGQRRTKLGSRKSVGGIDVFPLAQGNTRVDEIEAQPIHPRPGTLNRLILVLDEKHLEATERLQCGGKILDQMMRSGNANGIMDDDDVEH